MAVDRKARLIKAVQRDKNLKEEDRQGLIAAVEMLWDNLMLIPFSYAATVLSETIITRCVQASKSEAQKHDCKVFRKAEAACMGFAKVHSVISTIHMRHHMEEMKNDPDYKDNPVFRLIQQTLGQSPDENEVGYGSDDDEAEDNDPWR